MGNWPNVDDDDRGGRGSGVTRKQKMEGDNRMERKQVAQLSQRNRAAAWVSFGWP